MRKDFEEVVLQKMNAQIEESLPDSQWRKTCHSQGTKDSAKQSILIERHTKEFTIQLLPTGAVLCRACVSRDLFTQ